MPQAVTRTCLACYALDVNIRAPVLCASCPVDKIQHLCYKSHLSVQSNPPAVSPGLTAVALTPNIKVAAVLSSNFYR